MSDRIDPQALAEQYRMSDNLRNRIDLHSRFSTNPYPWNRWLFDHFGFPPRSRILELGCGPGMLWRDNQDRFPLHWRPVLADLSAGMLNEARAALEEFPTIAFYQIDAQALPFPDGTFSAVIANHMLYHLPDREQAFAEIRRVLRSGGQFFASTVGKKHMQELWEMLEPLAPGIQEQTTRNTASFTLENGSPQLSPWFSRIALYTYEDSLVVTEAAPLVNYALSVSSMLKHPFGEEHRGPLTQRFQQILDTEGAIYISKSQGLFSAIKN